MRVLALFLLFGVIFGSPAVSAQTAATPANAQIDQSVAARDLLHALMFDTGLFDRAANEWREATIPQMRARVTDSELRSSLSPAGQARLDQYITGLPAFFEQEVRAGAYALIDVTVDRAQHLFSADEWRGISAFIRTPEGRAVMTKLDAGDREAITSEEMEATRRFYASPSGQAYARRGTELNRILYETMEEQLPLITAPILDQSFRQLCEALAEECPTYLRDRITDR
jgi:hypothetical protein